MIVKFFPMVPKRDWSLVKRELGLKWVEDTRGIIAVDQVSGRVLAGCIFNNWTHNAVQVHFWISNPMVIRHGFFQEVCRYVFDVAGREKMVGMVPGDNAEALKLDKHLGFRETHRITGGYMYDVDYVILEAVRADLSRWLPQEEVVDGWERRTRRA